MACKSIASPYLPELFNMEVGKMSKAAKFSILLGGLFVIWALTLLLCREPIERDLAHRIALAFNRPEFNSVSVSMDGRDATLSGTIPSSALAQEAEMLASKVWGVRIVRNNLEVTDRKAAVFAILQGFSQDGKFILKGLLPDHALANRFFQLAEQAYGAGKASSIVAIDPAAELPDFFEPAFRAFLNLKGIDTPGFSISHDKFVLTGKVATNELKEKLGTEFRSALGPLPLQNDLEVQQTKPGEPSVEDLMNFLAKNPIYFEFGSSRLTRQAQELLDQILEWLNQFPDTRFELEGHSDNIGSDEYNWRLSRARAIAVRLYLLERGVAPERLSIKAYGETKPVASNSTELGRQRNRRVEFRSK